MHIDFDEEELNPEPVELEDDDHLYLDLFQNLSSIRHVGDSGLDPIQPDQIKHWEGLMGITITFDEARLMLDIDKAYRLAIAKERERNKPQTGG